MIDPVLQVMGDMIDIQKTHSCIVSAKLPYIAYARGFLERDLSADSKWSKTTSAHINLNETEEHPKLTTSTGIASFFHSSGASSSSDGQPSRDLDFVSMQDIAGLASHFLGEPVALLNICPQAKFSSKMRAVPDPHLYLKPIPPPPPQPKRGGGSRPWVRESVWDRSESDSDDG